MAEVISMVVGPARSKPPSERKLIRDSDALKDQDEISMSTKQADTGTDTRVLRAAAYCRVSSASEEQDGSFETQMSTYEKKINAAPNLSLVKIYGDHGFSGGNVKRRKQFQQMIQDCRDGKIDVILTKSISRFARNLSDTLKYVQELKLLGIPVWFEKENLNSMDPSCELLLGVLAAVAQEELNDLSQNVRWSVGKSQAAGNPKRTACYGYRKCMQGDQCIWKICEPEAERVRTAFQMAEGGSKYWEILECLQQMEEKEGTGVMWNQQRLIYLLHHEAYTGDLIAEKYFNIDCLSKRHILNHGEYAQYFIEDHHEPLISREQYEKVQDNMRNDLLKQEASDEIPDRWRSYSWKKKHGWKEPDISHTSSKASRGCMERSKGGEENVRCIYGRTDCRNRADQPDGTDQSGGAEQSGEADRPAGSGTVQPDRNEEDRCDCTAQTA